MMGSKPVDHEDPLAEPGPEGINPGPRAGRVTDYLALALSTVGVGYLPLAPGTWGSIVGVVIYVVAVYLAFTYQIWSKPVCFAVTAVAMILLSLAAIWSSDRTAVIKRGKDPQIVVIDEVLGQLVTFVFIPFTLSWWPILTGFVLFRVFDIWKPYPIRVFESLPGGIGICADDVVAGLYAGVCLAVFYPILFY
ncbi:MAG: phosphatidylglycerophosphatase A [Acidobacteriota bacterium]|nr:phosphatidylglycerophosphatase A [Acidobacteriota bacterium]